MKPFPEIDSSQLSYPSDEQIRVHWSAFDISVLAAIFIALLAMTAWTYWHGAGFSPSKICSIFGLYVGIIGAIMAARRTPHFGLFTDGGEVQRKREFAESVSFRRGMWLVALGLLLQAVGVL